MCIWLQDKGNMFKEMHKVRNMYLARLHERLARDLMRQRMADDSDRYVPACLAPLLGFGARSMRLCTVVAGWVAQGGLDFTVCTCEPANHALTWWLRCGS